MSELDEHYLPVGSNASGDGAADKLPFPETGLSPALQRTIRAKIKRGELDEVDHDVFKENLRKVAKKND